MKMNQFIVQPDASTQPEIPVAGMSRLLLSLRFFFLK